jgi:hypothetical protein
MPLNLCEYFVSSDSISEPPLAPELSDARGRRWTVYDGDQIIWFLIKAQQVFAHVAY